MPDPDVDENKDEGVTRVTRDSEVASRIDTVFDVLRVARRRYLLYVLYETENVVLSVEEIVEAVRRYEATDTETGELPPSQPVRTSLVHAHLPRLASVGILDFDIRRGNVRFYGYPPLEEWLERTRYLELD